MHRVALFATMLLACSTSRKSLHSNTVAEGPVTSVPALGAPAACRPDSAAGLSHCVVPGRIEQDILSVALPRPPGSTHHVAVRDRCAHRLAELGFEVEHHAYGTGFNVVGTRPGFSKGGEQVVLGAHYDHLPHCSGADDNASGVAAVLESARVLASSRFDRTLVVGCWDQGEQRQAGSAAYAQRAKARDQRIQLAVSLEAVGFASTANDSQRVPDRFEEAFPDQMLALIDDEFRADFALAVVDVPSEDLVPSLSTHAGQVPLRLHTLVVTNFFKAKQGDFHRSDHTPFWEAGYRALLITDTSSFRNPNIHCRRERNDTPNTLDFGFVSRVTQLTVRIAADALKIRTL